MRTVRLGHHRARRARCWSPAPEVAKPLAEVLHRPDACRHIIDLAGVWFGIGYELRNRHGGESGLYDHDAGKRRDAGYRGKGRGVLYFTSG